jgi:hypothetical protein
MDCLIVHLLFTLIHKRVKESEKFITMVSLSSNNLGLYICFVSKLIMGNRLSATQRDINKIQIEMFTSIKADVFESP